MVRTSVLMLPEDSETPPEPSLSEGPEGVIEVCKLTFPENPKRLASVRLELDEEPGAMVKVLGVAARLKSVTATVTFTDSDSEPTVAVTVTTYVPGELELTIKVAEWDWPGEKDMLIGLRTATRPI